MLWVTVTLTFDLLTRKSIAIIYVSWPFLIPRKFYLGEISFANAGQTDTHTEGRTDGRRVS